MSPASTNEKDNDLAMADSMLTNILNKYNVEKYGLLQETYPANPDNKITYLAEGTMQKRNQEVSFLWPYSGMLSGVISLYKNTGDEKYLRILEERILPGLELYWDNIREPFCYQSYPMFNGESDRFYDDNDWLAIDFCDLYALTKNEEYLHKAQDLHKYIYSGWSDELEGGIYWCEQKKTSKNTCSNAPAAVLCMKLYNLTQDNDYLDLAKKTYNWTMKYLCDPEDSVYWDNIKLNGTIGKAKYTYNSGQMIQAGVLLYKATGDEQFLNDAKRTAKGSYEYFTKIRRGINGTNARFYSASPWFNVILSRGLIALYEIDNNPEYINTMAENARYAWMNARDENGFLGNDWTGNDSKPFKWLLDNACMIELYSEIGNIK
ncbi:glycoside hydrolase family 76 protein [Parabacteroides bouchesdurhonensis]|uniref:glycoside hydrolase family 76 protein n=1 Tax=Parabacteroides bouchesdurhonensis TaxID=1936995 RepID=UPI001F210BB2|nr:glycoside hydrolase family 76 protein [Parabacteroides bouchesdurhonensis]